MKTWVQISRTYIETRCSCRVVHGIVPILTSINVILVLDSKNKQVFGVHWPAGLMELLRIIISERDSVSKHKIEGEKLAERVREFWYMI